MESLEPVGVAQVTEVRQCNGDLVQLQRGYKVVKAERARTIRRERNVKIFPRMKDSMSYSHSEFKRRFPAIAGYLDLRDIEILGRALVPIEVAAGDVLITCGMKSDTLYLIWRGLLAVSIEAGRKRLLLGEVAGGKWVGEITMLEPGPATATVLAKEDSTLLALSNGAFEKLREEYPRIAGSLVKALSLNLAGRLRSCRQFLIKINEDQYFVESTGDNREDRLVALGRMLMGLGGGKT